MADTGWLKPSYSSAVSMEQNPEHIWNRPYNISNDIIYGANSWTTADSIPEDRDTDVLLWNWVLPANVPANAVIVGIEARFYGYYYQSVYLDGDYDVNITYLQFGDALVVNEGTGNPATQIFRIQTPDDFPDRLLPLPPEYLLEFGGPTELFTLAPGTRVSDYFNTIAYSGALGNKHCSLRISQYNNPLARECGIYTSSVQLKIHYEIPSSSIDLEASPQVTLSLETASDLQVIKRLEAMVNVDMFIEAAQLGGAINLEVSPAIAFSMPADISNAPPGTIDNTAAPEIEFSIEDAGLQLIRHIDLAAAPVVELSMRAGTTGYAIDLAASPKVSITLLHGLYRYVDMDVFDDRMVVNVSLPPPALQSNYDLSAAPTILMSLDAPQLEGDFTFADACEPYEGLIVEFSIEGVDNLGYTKELESDPIVYFTLGGVDNLGNKAEILAGPVVVFSIPKADLRSKYGEPAPDSRTIFACPDDRTIIFCPKDTSAL